MILVCIYELYFKNPFHLHVVSFLSALAIYCSIYSHFISFSVPYTDQPRTFKTLIKISAISVLGFVALIINSVLTFPSPFPINSLSFAFTVKSHSVLSIYQVASWMFAAVVLLYLLS